MIVLQSYFQYHFVDARVLLDIRDLFLLERVR